MLAHGTYTVVNPRRIRCGNATFDLVKGATFEVLQSDPPASKQVARFSARDVDWFHDGDLEDLAGVDYDTAARQW